MNKLVKNTGLRHLYRSYLTGFVLSLVITVAAFLMVMLQQSATSVVQPGIVFVAVLVLLAVIQLVVQLLFFFHLGTEAKPRLNTVSFLFMLMVVSIIMGGSLWIMHNLDYNMAPHQVDTYIQNEENIHKDTMKKMDMKSIDMDRMNHMHGGY